jgi:hypothetical protein
VSGHFFFTIGKHCVEYKYDPEIYFAGDEISLSIRSFTLGYDLFHPHKVIVWHEYIRSKNKKHWDDFDSSSKSKGKVDNAWHELDDISKKRLRQMLREENNNLNLGVYTLGNTRTHHEYELYTGICFKLRKLHPNTINGSNPPIHEPVTQWLSGNQSYSLPLSVPNDLGSGSFTIEIYSKEGNMLHQQHITQHSPIITMDFSSNEIPYKWTCGSVNKKEFIFGETLESLWETYSTSIKQVEVKQCPIDYIYSSQNECISLQSTLFL